MGEERAVLSVAEILMLVRPVSSMTKVQIMIVGNLRPTEWWIKKGPTSVIILSLRRRRANPRPPGIH